MTDHDLAAVSRWASPGRLGDDGAMNRIDDDERARRIADALMAHGLVAAALERRADASQPHRAGELASLDAALADRLADLDVDAETMAAAMARVVLALTAATARGSGPAPRR